MEEGEKGGMGRTFWVDIVKELWGGEVVEGFAEGERVEEDVAVGEEVELEGDEAAGDGDRKSRSGWRDAIRAYAPRRF